MASLLVFFGVGEVPVDVAEVVSNLLAESLSGLLGLEVVLSGVLEVSKLVDDEAGRHDVGLVDVLDEGLDSGLLDELLLVVAAFGSDQVTGDAGDEEVRESEALNR